MDWDGDGAEGAAATGSEEDQTPPAAPSAARRGGRARAQHVRHRLVGPGFGPS